ncbi:chemotaxis protein CheW [Rhodopirellula sp. MGV]|uniref:chemotaxis protein CheW n=1 Tax=Rhodopirellula sp. MGV TaxID=2023130 RepID=UPI000B979049|nr:chemotaxis protein CheW [Rhodopirellula sp. MGV]OYP36315.1 chemotaxis protein CheW [Rhodopirellula sp. MGV]PNY38451.1 chemotaxis protein CheW [Rhodopirellula baltica]
MSQQSSQQLESYCTFRVDDLLFGVEVCQVQEVIRTHPTTSVPLAPAVVHGLMNLRGQIVSALNLRYVLGMPPAQSDHKPMNVVVRSSEGPISLLVDEIGDVVQVDRDRFEPLPETLQSQQREMLTGAFKLEGKLLLILDIDRVLAIPA